MMKQSLFFEEYNDAKCCGKQHCKMLAVVQYTKANILILDLGCIYDVVVSSGLEEKNNKCTCFPREGIM